MLITFKRNPNSLCSSLVLAAYVPSQLRSQTSLTPCGKGKFPGSDFINISRRVSVLRWEQSTSIRWGHRSQPPLVTLTSSLGGLHLRSRSSEACVSARDSGSGRWGQNFCFPATSKQYFNNLNNYRKSFPLARMSLKLSYLFQCLWSPGTMTSRSWRNHAWAMTNLRNDFNSLKWSLNAITGDGKRGGLEGSVSHHSSVYAKKKMFFLWWQKLFTIEIASGVMRASLSTLKQCFHPPM